MLQSESVQIYRGPVQKHGHLYGPCLSVKALSELSMLSARRQAQAVATMRHWQGCLLFRETSEFPHRELWSGCVCLLALCTTRASFKTLCLQLDSA